MHAHYINIQLIFFSTENVALTTILYVVYPEIKAQSIIIYVIEHNTNFSVYLNEILYSNDNLLAISKYVYT